MPRGTDDEFRFSVQWQPPQFSDRHLEEYLLEIVDLKNENSPFAVFPEEIIPVRTYWWEQSDSTTAQKYWFLWSKDSIADLENCKPLVNRILYHSISNQSTWPIGCSMQAG